MGLFSPLIMTAMLDTNIFDQLLLDQNYVALLRDFTFSGVLRLFATGVQQNQITQIPDLQKREKLIELFDTLNVETVAVEFAPYGYMYGECYGGLSPDVVLDHNDFVGSNNKQIEDAIIAATASSTKYKFDYVVTNDKSFTRRMNRQDIMTKAISFQEFKLKTSQLQGTK